MSRTARQASATNVYHIMVRGLDKMPVFYESAEKSRILILIRDNLSNFDVVIYAYCIMPNHLHLLIKADLNVLASYMASVLTKFASYYNYKHERIGYVFQDRYKSQCVETESYFWNCMRYIHRNPAKHGTAKDMLAYPYSSFSHLYDQKCDIISNEALAMIAHRFQDRQQFLEFHNTQSWDIFDDTDEDTQEDRLRISKEILTKYQGKYDLSSRELLDYVSSRKEIEKEIRTVLKISEKKAAAIIKIIQKEQMGTG